MAYQLSGVDAVMDKDYVASLLGIAVGAQLLLVLTDESAVMERHGTPKATPLTALDPNNLDSMGFPAESMGPKIDACRRFVTATGAPSHHRRTGRRAGTARGHAGATTTPTTPRHRGSHEVDRRPVSAE
jgi:carbamate kinase